MKDVLIKIQKKLITDSKSLQKSIAENFTRAYEWDRHSSLYKIMTKLAYIEFMLEGNLDQVETYLVNIILNSQHEYSTNQGSNRASLLRIEAARELRSDLGRMF